MVVRPAAQRPMKLAIRFGDWVLVDARMAFPHQAIFGKLPVLVAIGAEPLATIIAIFVGISDGNTIAGESPEFFDQTVVELLIPLAGQESLGLGPVLRELDAIAPTGIERVGKRHFGGIAAVPAILCKTDLFNGALSGEWGKRRTDMVKFLSG